MSKGGVFHIVSKQTNGSASGKRVALVPLNAMKRIEKLHASNVHTAKNWERKEIRIFDKQMSCNEYLDSGIISRDLE